MGPDSGYPEFTPGFLVTFARDARDAIFAICQHQQRKVTVKVLAQILRF